jgi:lambda family phage minor tail protein L
LSTPTSHVAEAQKLEVDAFVDLFSVAFHNTSSIYRFRNGASITWQGQVYEELACQLSGEQRNADGTNTRPKLNVVNPQKVLGSFAAEGYFDLALVTRYRLLQQDLLNNVNIFQKRVWIVGKVNAVTSQTLELELRDTTDNPAWKTPRRTYSPSEGYPFVSV